MNQVRHGFQWMVTGCLAAGMMFCPTAFAQGGTATVAPNDLAGVGIDQNLQGELPLGLHFVDAHGQDVALRDYFGDKPVILSFVYYDCPMLCTMILNGLVNVVNTLDFNIGKDFEVVTLSFDPRETPDLALGKKRAYMSKYGRPGAAKGWHFLTGQEENIKQLTQAAGFRYTFNPERNEFIHASGIMIATPEGKLSRYFYGIEYAPRDVKLGLIEAGKEKIGSVVDQILLYCYHYDPTTGKYGLVIMNVIRLLGSLTVLVLLVFMVTMLRKDRRAQRAASAHS